MVAIVEIADELGGQGIENVSDPNIGGTVEFDGGWVKLVPAWHTSTTPAGPSTLPAGMVDRDRRQGRLPPRRHLPVLRPEAVGERDPVDVALDPDRRPLHDGPRGRRGAAELVGATTVIPCHYNTFPPIETDAQAFKADVEQRTGVGPPWRCWSRAGLLRL